MKRTSTERDLTLLPLDPTKHYPSWPDILGRPFRPGDVVAVGITAGRCASLTIGMVRRINRFNSSGEPYMRRPPARYVDGKWVNRDEAVPDCSVTVVPLLDSENRLGRWSTRDSTVGPEKIVRLDVPVSDVLRAADAGGAAPEEPAGVTGGPVEPGGLPVGRSSDLCDRPRCRHTREQHSDGGGGSCQVPGCPCAAGRDATGLWPRHSWR